MWIPYHRRPSFIHDHGKMQRYEDEEEEESDGFFLTTPKTEKLHEMCKRVNEIEIAHSSIQGYRVSMEDQFIVDSFESLNDHTLVAVFDGHAGTEVAKFASVRMQSIIESTAQWLSYIALANKSSKAGLDFLSSALVQAFVNIDVEVAENNYLDMSGCAAVCALITPTHIICANAGDSRCVVGTTDKVVSMSEDHKPTLPEESERIVNAGGTVSMDRVNGELAMSRAFGDFQYKSNEALPQSQQMVVPFPDITIHKRSPKDEILVVACDGVWDVFDNKEAASFLIELKDALLSKEFQEQQDLVTASAALSMKRNILNMSVVPVALDLARALVEESLTHGSTDNISAVVAVLSKAHQQHHQH